MQGRGNLEALQDDYKKIGYFQSVRRPDGDLGELVAGKKPGRQNESELTIGVNLGLARCAASFRRGRPASQVFRRGGSPICRNCPQ